MYLTAKCVTSKEKLQCRTLFNLCNEVLLVYVWYLKARLSQNFDAQRSHLQFYKCESTPCEAFDVMDENKSTCFTNLTQFFNDNKLWSLPAL